MQGQIDANISPAKELLLLYVLEYVQLQPRRLQASEAPHSAAAHRLETVIK